MKTHVYAAELWLPRPRAEVFPFFADARNLEAITPPWLSFRILTPGSLPMKEGLVIDYRLAIRGLRFNWRTEITVWEPPHRFVDLQRRGPYRLWRHEHRFLERDGGTLCRDEVVYSVPGGALVERLLVRRQVKRIFAYREEALRARFMARAAAVEAGR